MFLTALELVLVTILLIIIIRWICNFRSANPKRILIIVLGDIGRSPRMQYHALSFAKEHFMIDIVGYNQSPLIEELQYSTQFRILALWEPPTKPSWLPRLLYYVFKTLYMFIQLLTVVLWKTSKHSYVLVQNPPAIPTLSAAWLICLFRCSHLIIDWHNYGYTILSLAVGNTNPLVRFSRVYEGFFGRRATYNICVTKAMKEDLQQRWNITATTLYDRPPKRFQCVDEVDKHKIFLKLSEKYDVFKPVSGDKRITETRFTHRSSDDNPDVNNEKSRSILKHDRPALLISSTSWTEDEDFSILLDALKEYDKLANTKSLKLPKLVCVITGKGPLKSHYQKIISETTLNHVEICTPWLEAYDYPVLVGSADLGICLHTSSSGLDLPMKVVDMFGCGVPVCAIGFPCLDELVKHGENGLVFNSATQLAKQLQELLAGFPENQELLNKFRENLREFQKKRWHACWKETFFNPIFKS